MRAGLLGAACTAVLSPLLVARFGLNGAGIALLVSNVVSSAMTIHGLRGVVRSPSAESTSDTSGPSPGSASPWPARFS